MHLSRALTLLPKRLLPRSRSFFVFLIAGSVGFALEYGIIWFGQDILGVGPRWPRAVSFPLAIYVTWRINRAFGFQVTTPPNLPEFVRYLGTTLTGGAINAGLYLALTYLHPVFYDYPGTALVLATSVSLVFNYTSMRLFVFRRS